MLLKKKKAQVYLLAAFIIIALIISLASLVNYIQIREKPKKFYDLSSNIDLEGANIIKYGLYEEQNITSIIVEFTKIFSQYLEETGEKDTSLIIISGNLNSITISVINNTATGDISIKLGNEQETVILNTAQNNIVISEPEDLSNNPKITIELANNITQTFKLNPGQNFLFVLTKNQGLEDYIETNTQSEDEKNKK